MLAASAIQLDNAQIAFRFCFKNSVRSMRCANLIHMKSPGDTRVKIIPTRPRRGDTKTKRSVWPASVPHCGTRPAGPRLCDVWGFSMRPGSSLLSPFGEAHRQSRHVDTWYEAIYSSRCLLSIAPLRGRCTTRTNVAGWSRGPAAFLGVHLCWFLSFRCLQGLAGWFGGGVTAGTRGVTAGTRGQSAKEANVDTLGECIYSKR